MSSLYEKILINKELEQTAIYYENKQIAYPELFENIHKVAAFFADSGVKKGDVVTVALPNIPTAVYVLYALNALGVVQNNVHPLTPIADVIDSAKKTGSVMVVLLATVYKSEKERIDASGLKFAFANPMYDSGIIKRNLFYLKFGKIKKSENRLLLDEFRKKEPLDEFESHDSQADSFYLHSGGTTSTPKIIALSDDAINNLVDKVDEIITSDKVNKGMYAVLPTFHGFGLAMGIHTPLVWKMHSGLVLKYDPEKLIKWINAGKINYIIGVPVLYQKLMKSKNFAKANLKNLEYAFVGGDSVSPGLVTKFNEIMAKSGSSCRMCEGYGLTETVTVCAVNTRENYLVGSVGKPLRGISVTARDDDFNVLPPNEVGEIYVAGDTLMNCYYRDEEATKGTVVSLDGTPTIRTGDLGFVDENGFVFLKGRKKRMFKISGINVYPAEVEKIATDRESVYDAALEYFDQPKPHLVLFVILNKNGNYDEKSVAAEISDELKNKVLKYCLPEKIVFKTDFPKTGIGKIDHNELKREYLR